MQQSVYMHTSSVPRRARFQLSAVQRQPSHSRYTNLEPAVFFRICTCARARKGGEEREGSGKTSRASAWDAGGNY